MEFKFDINHGDHCKSVFLDTIRDVVKNGVDVPDTTYPQIERVRRYINGFDYTIDCGQIPDNIVNTKDYDADRGDSKQTIIDINGSNNDSYIIVSMNDYRNSSVVCHLMQNEVRVGVYDTDLHDTNIDVRMIAKIEDAQMVLMAKTISPYDDSSNWTYNLLQTNNLSAPDGKYGFDYIGHHVRNALSRRMCSRDLFGDFGHSDVCRIVSSRIADHIRTFNVKKTKTNNGISVFGSPSSFVMSVYTPSDSCTYTVFNSIVINKSEKLKESIHSTGVFSSSYIGQPRGYMDLSISGSYNASPHAYMLSGNAYNREQSHRDTTDRKDMYSYSSSRIGMMLTVDGYNCSGTYDIPSDSIIRFSFSSPKTGESASVISASNCYNTPYEIWIGNDDQYRYSSRFQMKRRTATLIDKISKNIPTSYYVGSNSSYHILYRISGDVNDAIHHYNQCAEYVYNIGVVITCMNEYTSGGKSSNKAGTELVRSALVRLMGESIVSAPVFGNCIIHRGGKDKYHNYDVSVDVTSGHVKMKTSDTESIDISDSLIANATNEDIMVELLRAKFDVDATIKAVYNATLGVF